LIYRSNPLVFKITGYSTHDGPGIRSVVFLKGCPLSCLWCHNPESQKPNAELWWEKDRCITDADCISVCPEEVLNFSNKSFVDWNRCTSCLKCVPVCPSTALSACGTQMTPDEITDSIIEYKDFYDTSGGGVTISGGEPAMHIDFLSELLKKLKQQNINTLVETSGYFNLKRFRELCLPYTDTIYYDIKLIDPVKHKTLCGTDNQLILDNFVWLQNNCSYNNTKLLPRIPLIPDLTDNDENIDQSIHFFLKHGVTNIALLPNNPLWFNKELSIGKRNSIPKDSTLFKLYPNKKLQYIRNLFTSNGINVLSD